MKTKQFALFTARNMDDIHIAHLLPVTVASTTATALAVRDGEQYLRGKGYTSVVYCGIVNEAHLESNEGDGCAKTIAA